MQEVTLESSRLGQVSTLTAVLDLVVLGTLILIRLNVPNDWLDEEDSDKLMRTARWVMFGNWATALFPVFAMIGLAIGLSGYVQTAYAKFFSLLGIGFNGFLLFAWIVGIVWYLDIFRLDRFYVK